MGTSAKLRGPPPVDDVVASPKFAFDVPGHTRYSYYLSSLIGYYGEAFCTRFARAWSSAATFSSEQTSGNYFKTVRTAFLLIAKRGATGSGTPEEAVYKQLRDENAPVIGRKIWATVVANLATSILKLNDDSFIASKNSRSRNKKIESLRAGLRWLSERGFVPEADPEGRLNDTFSPAAKCLATLSFEAGRLDISKLSSEEAAQAFVRRNREMLDELRRCLWLELKSNAELFEIGKKLTGDTKLPDTSNVITVLRSTPRDQVSKVAVKLGIDPDQERALVLKLLKEVAAGYKPPIGRQKLNAFLYRYFTNSEAHPYIEATSIALNAAYHIVLIDTGGNVQPLDDLPLKLYKSTTKRARREIRSLFFEKNRAGGKRVPAHLHEKLFLSTAGTKNSPSGVEVVETYKMLSEPMRASTGPTAERLWVWRMSGKGRVSTDLISMAQSRWPDFLKRIVGNPLIGGLAINRQVIRRAVANSRLELREFDIETLKASLGQESAKISFGYLSEGAVRAFLNNEIRRFLNSWEAGAVKNIDDAAAKLGVSEPELYRRSQLGVENGLAFADLTSATCEADINSVDAPPMLLDPTAQLFVVSDKTMTTLSLARLALHEQLERMINANPMRFVRMWMPWLAIVEGYCQRLEQSRFRVRFRKISSDVDRQLRLGKLSLPLLW
jgi:hypothetical protein